MPDIQNNQINITGNKPGVVTITLGENVLGGNEALDFSSKLYELNQQGIKCVVVNLQNVKMINSSGLGMLVGGLNTLKKNDIKMLLAGLSEKIDVLLNMTHLNQVFTIFNNVDDALESCE
ncbi:STAS domain-containing protein [Bacteroidota bacterium]